MNLVTSRKIANQKQEKQQASFVMFIRNLYLKRFRKIKAKALSSRSPTSGTALLCTAVFFSFFISACATPPRKLPQTKTTNRFPLRTALIFSEAEMKLTWKPGWEYQGLKPGPIHVGRIASQVTQEAMSSVFNDVFIAKSEAAARSSGAKALISVKWSTRNTGVLSPTLVTALHITVKSLDNVLLASLTEQGTYNHFWTPLDDGAFHNSLTDASKRIIPRLLRDRRIHTYAKGIPVTMAKPQPTSASKPSLTVQHDYNIGEFGQYNALIIGNNKYTKLSNLATAKNDALALADVLKRKYRFKNTILLLDATRADILKALTYLRKRLTNVDNLLIYYAGHGWHDEDADEGYWLPVDADRDNPTNWVSNASITAVIRATKAKHIMVIADSCYSGKLSRSISVVGPSTGVDFRRLAKKRSCTVLSSGGLEPVMDRGGGEHSVFAKTFLQMLEENEDILEGHRLFTLLRRPVMLNSDQTPEYSDIRKAGHDGGDFLFIRRK